VHRLGLGAMRIVEDPVEGKRGLLDRSRVMLPIPGTSKVEHLEANLRAAQ
jgi:hypothetical protein